MPNWAKNDWPTAAYPDGDDLNDFANSIRTWGYSETPGTVTINANENALSNAGDITSLTRVQAPALRVEAANADVPQLTLKQTDGGANAKLWKTYVASEWLYFACSNDADSANNPWLSVSRSGASPAGAVFSIPVSMAAFSGVLSATDAILRSMATGSNHSAIARLVARQSSSDDEWNIVAAGSGLGSSGLRIVNGAWTGTPVFTLNSSTLTLNAQSDTPNGIQLHGASSTSFALLSGIHNSGAGYMRLGFWTGSAYGRVRIQGFVDEPELAASGSYANDAAAQAAGVPIGGRYRNGSVMMIRVA
jgi:hypothetical protein